MTDVITSDSVASVSLTDADQDPDAFAQELGQSFVEYGFAIVRDHGIPQELIDRAEDKAKAFFALPEEVKRKYLIPGGGGARGYTAFGVETAKGAQALDLKEFWHVGRELAAGHDYRDVMGDNVWPTEVPGFQETFLELYDAFDARRAQDPRRDRALPRGRRGLFRRHGPRRQFGDALLHYPPQTEPTGNHIRAGAHEDINTITCCSAPRKRGWNSRPRTAAGSRSARSRANWWSTSATCCSG